MNDVQKHLAKMMRIVGIEKITARNSEKVWVRIRMWEEAIRCSRWNVDADERRFTTVEEVRENVGVIAADGTKKLPDVQFDRQLAHNVRVEAEKSYASQGRLN
ncbi:hypothetical protein ACLF6K_06225 [Streptomyces xanthophaeus]|uniref:hypothetical protein n=1 Tax=Streptomyces xanthophaeus TaxID=67385 RepID=UPI00398FEE47